MSAAAAVSAPVPAAALPTVRLALPADEEPIMAMCRRLHAENGLFTFSQEKVAYCLQRYYERKGAIVGVIGPVGAIEASTCLLFSDMYYTDDWHLAELWNFVDKEFRRSHNAEALIDFGMRSARKTGVPLITGIITNTRTASKIRLYRRLLGPPSGAFFVFNANWAADSQRDDEIWKVLLSEQSRLRELPRGARVVPPETLQRLGDGDIERGRVALDNFLNRHRRPAHTNGAS